MTPSDAQFVSLDGPLPPPVQIMPAITCFWRDYTIEVFPMSQTATMNRTGGHHPFGDHDNPVIHADGWVEANDQRGPYQVDLTPRQEELVREACAAIVCHACRGRGMQSHDCPVCGR